MYDLTTLKQINNRATRQSQRNGKVPVIWQGEASGFRVPFIGDRTPRGWKRTKREPLFVDTSGFGTEGEPAMTTRQFLASLEKGKGYGLIEQGQFQGYVAEFEQRAT